ncbi:MAG TPA: hypothetical protein PKZ73_01555 [Methanomassiliicoccales archaeon]|nr:hypothetical protein [Methanomassiliicoccales archaeon]
MSYSERAKGLLARSKADEGDTVRLRAGGREHVGILMPHHGFSHPDVIVIKLGSGYNIGVRVDDGSELIVEAKAGARAPRPMPPQPSSGLPAVSFLGTGGTIASYVDYRTGAVHPALRAEELVATSQSWPGYAPRAPGWSSPCSARTWTSGAGRPWRRRWPTN